ncbi:hypothetical protein IM792_10415 [Mucilaginibacter sp. JRF]|uniref:hypothetical protein n=1 Tax=Mucilaginibacter sp. JRF TaxID=2780088 RepID=UPI0018803648|nr:hypothetical protein [Mucilaginibacter sp. JRF]MBE9584860.1 hypothetical protein [Mucilaginibacter sp. JRF]
MKPLSLIFFTTLVCLSSCFITERGDNSVKTLDFKYFTIEVPESWQQVKARGIDSYVGEIHIDTGTIIRFDLGWYTDPMNEDEDQDRYSVHDGSIYLTDSSSTPQHRVSMYFAEANTENLEKVRHNKIKWVTIDNHKAKLIIPKRPGIGTTGVFIDRLWRSGSNNDRFGLRGDRLTGEQQRQLLKAIMTLRFCEHPSER